MNPAELSRLILGSIILKPALLDSDDFDSSLFSSPRERRTFGLISQLYEDGRPTSIDPVILASRLGGDGGADFVGSLLAGLHRVPPESFQIYIGELRKARLSAKILRVIERQARGGGEFDFGGIREDIAAWDRLTQPAAAPVTTLAAVQERPIDWLWPGRIPRAMLSLLVGNPGEGKSILSLFIAARLSKGEPLPGMAEAGPPASSLFILGEDPLAEAVKPRALANGADVSRILTLSDAEYTIQNVGRLRNIASQFKDLALIVLDPLAGFLPPKTKYFEDPSMRSALLPLAEFAEASGLAVLAIAHLRKAEAESAIYRVAGSIGLAAIARSILSLSRDAENEDRRLLLPLKSNYSRKPPGLAFRIGDDLRITFESEPVTTTAETELAPHTRREELRGHNFAASWLREFLGPGPQDSKIINDAAKEAGISRRSLYRAAERLKVASNPHGFGQFKTSSWELPS